MIAKKWEGTGYIPERKDPETDLIYRVKQDVGIQSSFP